MQTVTYSDARQRLKETMDRVCADRNPVTIVRQRGDAVVMMSLDDYNSLMETFHLLRSPRNAERLLKAIRDARDRRNTVEHELIEP